jgi:hypothetical protein
MKQFFLLLPCLFCYFFAKTQVYVPFPTNATWYEAIEYQTQPNDYRAVNYRRYLSGDTAISGKTYRKLYGNQYAANEYVGALRENAEREIHFLPKDSTREHLLYKFGLSVGDSLVFMLRSGLRRVVKAMAIDSVLIGMTYRKRYRMSTPARGFDYWIEGIGSTKGLLFINQSLEFEHWYTLLCFNAGSGIDYKIDRASNNCTVSSNDWVLLPSKIYPNPANNFLQIDLENTDYQPITIQITDANGKIWQRKQRIAGEKQITINTTDLPNGIYFYQLQMGEKSSAGKFIVQH